jgi:hypothetical protein
MQKFFSATAIFLFSAAIASAQPDPKYKIHDLDRPVPPIVTPANFSPPDQPGKAPSDAIVLFDGTTLDKWLSEDGSPAKWKVENSYAEVVAHTHNIHTKDSFGDCQLHVEFMEPVPPHGESQERGNSGVFLMNTYEIQVLDSYENRTYADGQVASVYGQYPPLVNAARPPGQWQSYDIVFHGPRFDPSGTLLRPARVTVFHNGVLVQDNVELSGPTAHGERPPYKPGPDKGPLALQDHGNPVRYRNIWIRELK